MQSLAILSRIAARSLRRKVPKSISLKTGSVTVREGTVQEYLAPLHNLLTRPVSVGKHQETVEKLLTDV